ncbi:MAG: GNAT family protein [Pseudomonadota bacterium]
MSGIETNALGQPVGVLVETTLPRPRPTERPLIGRTIRADRLEPTRDAAELFAAFAQDTTGEGWTYLPYGPFDTDAEFRAWLVSDCSHDDPLFYTYRDAVSARVLGMGSFLRIDPAGGVIEVGHLHFAPSMQRQTAATEAMYLMMAHAFDDLGYRRYEWKCNALNAPSRRAAERLGFTYEGTFRQAGVAKGRNRDTSWYAIVDGDWPRIKAAFLAWLAPDNFDADGHQRAPLAACG